MKKLLLLILAIGLGFGTIIAQNDDNPKVCKAEKTIVKCFDNLNNQFILNGVGKVVIKESASNEIKCVVHVITYGATDAIAKERLDYITVSTDKGSVKKAPELDVKVRNGLYSKQHYDIVTTVYLPSTVNLQHNENMNFMDLLSKLIQKIIP